MTIPRRNQLHPLVWIEVLIAFVPISVFLAIGLFMAPFQLLLLAMSPEVQADPEEVVEVISLSVFGALAMSSLANLILAVQGPGSIWFGRRATIAFGTIGILTLCHLIVDSGTLPWRVFFSVPLIVALHIIYLGRAFLFDPNQHQLPLDK